MDGLNILPWIKKYRYILVVLLAGLALMMLPQREQTSETTAQSTVAADNGMETRLEQILSRIRGAGEVAVMLTEAEAEEIVYQTDGERADTVLVTDASRNEHGLVRTREPPIYRGAIVVCNGADSPAVQLAIVEAVANVTGLGTDKITVLKME